MEWHGGEEQQRSVVRHCGVGHKEWLFWVKEYSIGVNEWQFGVS